jgi:hypothetical protein
MFSSFFVINNDRNSKMGCLSIVMTWHEQTLQLIVPVIVIDENASFEAHIMI